MAVVQVRIMRMAVHQGLVPMNVRMRLPAIPVRSVGMLVMQVVRVRVRVLERLVDMLVLMALAYVQPHARGHQGRGRPE